MFQVWPLTTESVAALANCKQLFFIWLYLYHLLSFQMCYWCFMDAFIGKWSYGIRRMYFLQAIIDIICRIRIFNGLCSVEHYNTCWLYVLMFLLELHFLGSIYTYMHLNVNSYSATADFKKINAFIRRSMQGDFAAFNCWAHHKQTKWNFLNSARIFTIFMHLFFMVFFFYTRDHSDLKVSPNVVIWDVDLICYFSLLGFTSYHNIYF